MRVTLFVSEGPHQGKKFSFSDHQTFLVGRSKRCHFQLPKDDKYFSRVHFMIEVNPPFVALTDMNSRNKTYVNGQAASIYKQGIPLANASRKPGEWQTYDVIWTAPRFNPDGSLKSPAYVTAIQNGVLLQNHVALKGETRYIGAPEYHAHGPTPIKLQAHGDPSPPISFRNIWLREL